MIGQHYDLNHIRPLRASPLDNEKPKPNHRKRGGSPAVRVQLHGLQWITKQEVPGSKPTGGFCGCSKEKTNSTNWSAIHTCLTRALIFQHHEICSCLVLAPGRTAKTKTNRPLFLSEKKKPKNEKKSQARKKAKSEKKKPIYKVKIWLFFLALAFFSRFWLFFLVLAFFSRKGKMA